MPYLNNHFHIYDQHKRIMFQIVGKKYFIKWLNECSLERIVDCGRYKYFSTYTEMKKYLKNTDKDWESLCVIDEEENDNASV